LITYVITGKPGVGKTTLFNNVVSTLSSHRYVVGGIKAPEVRGIDGSRIGFKVIDIMSGEEAWLARVDIVSNIRVGKYGVAVNEASVLIENALKKSLEKADVIGIDEIGPMELKIPVFKRILLEVLDSTKPKILVVHYRLDDKEILSKLRNATKVVVDYSNRALLNSTLPLEILNKISRIYMR